mgnify:FL=1
MAELTVSGINAAIERGHIAQGNKFRADAVRYDKQNSCIIVDLVNGPTFAFTPRVVPGLKSATDEELAAVEILGAGYGLCWDNLNVDLSIAGLLAGVFGTKAYVECPAGLAKAAIAYQNGSGPRRQT